MLWGALGGYPACWQTLPTYEEAISKLMSVQKKLQLASLFDTIAAVRDQKGTTSSVMAESCFI